MRPEFFKQLYQLMKDNPNVWALTGDLGYGGFDKIKEEFPDRFINCGASEFSMVGIAAGLALEGKIVFTYTITSFYLRAMEMISTYIDHESIPVIMVGSGREQEYEHDGYSHNAHIVSTFMKHLPAIQEYYPEAIDEVLPTMEEIIADKMPAFLSLSKKI